MHHRHTSLPALLGLLALAPLTVHAFQPLITDDAGTQGITGNNQLEFAPIFTRSRTAGLTTRVDVFPIGYTRGVTETLDFFVALNQLQIRTPGSNADVSGLSNPVMGIKWRFYDNQESGTSLAIKPELHLPISADREAKGLGSGRTSWLLTAALTQTVSLAPCISILGMAGNAIVNPAAIPSCRSRIFRSRRFGK